MASEGYLIIADISGYTKFVAETEIEHAKGIMEQLFGAVVPSFDLPLKISGFQGDAIFAYSVNSDIASKQFILDFAERVYCQFSKSKERIEINSSCPCNACSGVGSLDLKIIVHYGEYLEQRAGSGTELAGKEVIKAFRLLKNSVTEKTGKNAYVLITEDAVKQMDIGDFFQSADYITESYEHIGEIKCVIHDLSDVWEKSRDAETIFVGKDEKQLIDEVVVSVPVNPDVAFTLCARPDLRTQFLGADKLELPDGDKQRVQKGTVYRCHHGSDVYVFEIRDWRQGEYLTGRYLLPMGLTLLETTEFSPVGSGTKISVRIGTLKDGNLMGKMMRGMVSRKLRGILAGAYQEHIKRIVDTAADGGQVTPAVASG